MSDSNPQAQPRSIIQFMDGERKGLIAQIIAVEGDTLKCLHRDFGGQTNFFDVRLGSGYIVCGAAALGPKAGHTEPPAPELPPPLNPQELLEPLPSDVKVQPLNAEPEEPSKVVPPPAKPYKPGHRTIRPSAANPFPEPRPEVPRRPFIATVKNGLGDQTEVTVNVRIDDDPNRHKGVVFMRAGKLIPNVKPFTLLGWKPKE